MGAAAARLLPGMLGLRHASASRSLVAAPDGHPLLGSVPGFDAGRVVLAVGAPQHAPALARAGAFTAACTPVQMAALTCVHARASSCLCAALELLDCVSVTDVPTAVLSPVRVCVAEAAAAEAAAAAALLEGAEEAAELAKEEAARGEGARDAERARIKDSDAASLLQRRAPRTSAADAAEEAAQGGWQPRTPRRPQ